MWGRCRWPMLRPAKVVRIAPCARHGPRHAARMLCKHQFDVRATGWWSKRRTRHEEQTSQTKATPGPHWLRRARCARSRLGRKHLRPGSIYEDGVGGQSRGWACVSPATQHDKISGPRCARPRLPVLACSRPTRAPRRSEGRSLPALAKRCGRRISPGRRAIEVRCTARAPGAGARRAMRRWCASSPLLSSSPQRTLSLGRRLHKCRGRRAGQ